MALPSVPQGYDSWNEFIEDNAPAVAQAQGLTLQEAKASLKLLYASEPIRSAAGQPYYREYNVFTNWASRALLPDQGRPWKLDLNISVANILQGTSSYWLDPSDFSTMFQDPAGTTPVTAVGQSVRLMLDKSRDLTLGPELVTNGTFDTATNWTLGSGWTISGGQANYAGLGVSAQSLSQSINLVAGRSYEITFTLVRQAGAFTPRIVGATVVSGTIRSTTGTFKEIITAPASPTKFEIFAGANAVGSVDNISVREIPGNHFTQANVANAPILGREPFGGRRNLLTFTEEFDDAAWIKAGTTITPNVVAAPDGTMTADEIRYSGGGANQFNAGLSTAVTTPITISFWARRGPVSTGLAALRVGLRNNGTIVVAAFNYTPTEEWQRFSFQYTPSGTGVDRIYFYNSGAASNNVPFYLWGAQFETGSTATPYQKVTTSFDVTEIGVPDCYYLAFDGTDDWLQSAATINPGAVDKAQVFAGVRKLMDDQFRTVVESSVASSANSGTIGLFAPGGARPDYTFRSRGSINTSVQSLPSFLSPTTNIVTGLGDISGSRAIIRVNGAQSALSTADQGTGNFLEYTHYIGRRGGVTNAFNGRIYGLVVRYGSNLSTAQIESIEDWTASKTGIVI
jgi:hypothetical protein